MVRLCAQGITEPIDKLTQHLRVDMDHVRCRRALAGVRISTSSARSSKSVYIGTDHCRVPKQTRDMGNESCYSST
jgi:hypothetical protein